MFILRAPTACHSQPSIAGQTSGLCTSSRPTRPTDKPNQCDTTPHRPPADEVLLINNRAAQIYTSAAGRPAPPRIYQIVSSRQRCTRSGDWDRERRRRCRGVVCGNRRRQTASERANERQKSTRQCSFGRAVSHPVSAGPTPPAIVYRSREFSAAILYCTRHVAPKIR